MMQIFALLLTIGSPTYQLSSETVDGISTLENQIELASDQAKDLFDFLSTHQKSLEYISLRDNEEAEDALRTVFRLIAVYGRKVQEGKKDLKPVAITKPTSSPSPSHAATTSPFIKLPRSVTSHPNRSEKAN